MIRIKVVKSFLAIHQFTVKFEHPFSIYDCTNKRRKYLTFKHGRNHHNKTIFFQKNKTECDEQAEVTGSYLQNWLYSHSFEQLILFYANKGECFFFLNVHVAPSEIEGV